MSKTWTKEEIAVKLESEDRWVVRAILALYERQTADERSSSATVHTNGRGFNGCDARFFSSLAQQILEHRATLNPKFRFPLSDKQIGIARRSIKKYAGQLAAIANEAAQEAAREAAEERVAVMAES